MRNQATVPGARLAIGRTSEVFEFGAGAVVKVPRPDVPSHWASMEASFTESARSLGLPAPAVEGLVTIDGREAIVFESIHGPTMWEAMVADPSSAAALGVELAEVQNAIHSAGIPGGVPGLVERLQTKVGDVDQLHEEEQAEAAALIDLLPRGAALLHGDLHPGNILISDSGLVVIDWFDATIGHPAADLVRSCLLMRVSAEGVLPSHYPSGDPETLGTACRAYLQAINHRLPSDDDDIDSWEALIAVARLSERADDDEALLAAWRSRLGDSVSHVAAMRRAACDD